AANTLRHAVEIHDQSADRFVFQAGAFQRVVQVGDVQFEVTGQTWPCKRMEEAQTGLLKALAKDWRGGVTCRVLVPGEIAVGDPVSIPVSPPEMVRRLP
ncbi:MAG: MOSC domain-containing protein, partial [Pseudomonadota bacterium]